MSTLGWTKRCDRTCIIGIDVLTSAVLVVVAFVLSVSLTPLVRRFALAQQMLDHPNVRSSHSKPIPRGGGIAIVAASTIAFVTLGIFGAVDSPVVWALTGGGLAIALIGYADDRRSIPIRVRIAVHFAAAIWAIYCVGEPSLVRIGGAIFASSTINKALAAIGVVWVLNLFNFMDGVDGIAASEAAFVAVGGSIACTIGGTSTGLATASLAFAAANVGFLIWNWPPAKIFMGDVGSGYLGYCIAVFGLASTRESPAALSVWLILGGVFFLDATITLARRILRGDRFQNAHRSHAYQWLARGWGSHQRVTLAAITVNVFWLFPFAMLALNYPMWDAWFLVASLIPLAVAFVVAGSGRQE